MKPRENPNANETLVQRYHGDRLLTSIAPTPLIKGDSPGVLSPETLSLTDRTLSFPPHSWIPSLKFNPPPQKK